MAKSPLTVTVITDTHYYAKSTGTEGKAYEAANTKSQLLLKYSAELLDAAFRQIKADKRTDIVLISGDTTSNGEYDSHHEFIEMLRDLKAAGKRVYVITATHDYQDDGQTNSYVGDEKVKIPAAKREELYDMYREFGPDEALSVHRDSMSYVVQLQEGYRLFAINNDRNLTGKSGISDDCYAWLCEQVEDAKKNNQFMLMMTHHPLIAPSPVYALIGKNDMMGEHDEIKDFLADLGISLVFTGHSHIHDISYDFSENGNVLYDISTSALAGYPGYYRTVRICGDNVHISSVKTDEPVNGLETELSEYLENKFLGMIDNTLEAAATDIDTFAACVDAMSIHPNVSYRIGWLVKPFARLIRKMRLGTFAKWVRSETGNADLSDIRDTKVFDFIRQLVLHLYSGNAPYTPDTAEYKVTMGFINIIDSVLKLLRIKFRLRDIVLPLLYNKGIDDREADIPFTADEKAVNSVCINKYEDTVSESKKGPAILALLILAVIILLPLIPAAAVLLAIGAGINEIIFYKKIRGN